jgi:hypothetical protein
MRPATAWSSRLLRSGPLASETHQIFAKWRFEDDADTNLRRGTTGHFGTRGWEDEVRISVGVRVRDFARIAPLVRLAQGRMSFDDWRDCLRLWLVATEEPFGTFVRDWLFLEREEGRSRVATSDVRAFVDFTWAGVGKAALSEDGRARAARDLMKTATDLRLLHPGKTRDIASPGIGDDAFVFLVHLIAGFEGSAARVVDSPYWRSAFMRPDDVHAALLRLHQFRKLDYQVAGSLVQLSLPYGDAMACAEAMAA